MSEVQISVRGTAEGRYAAERASVNARVAVEGPDREPVRRQALEAVERVQRDLAALEESGAVASWSSDRVRVFAERQRKRGEPQPPVHHARMSVRADFADFDALAEWVSALAAADDVEVQGIGWDIDPDHRRDYEAEVRRSAVLDAVAKARAYADAVGRESVEPTQLADAGMLDSEPDDRPRTMAASAEADRPRLRLKPRDIVVRVAVDARFAAR